MLPVASRPGLRPTPNRVRETLFNWLVQVLPGARCIDLFAGTGALGIEALSRGATSTLFVENNHQAAADITAALKTLGAEHDGRVLVADGTQLAPASLDGKADIIFIDPPFDTQLHATALANSRPLLTDNGRVYIEYPARQESEIAALIASQYEPLRQGIAGDVGYCLARVRHNGEHDRHE